MRRSRRRSRSEQEALLSEWEASGLTAKQFAATRDVSVSQLYTWRRRLEVAEPGETSGVGRLEFIELASPPVAETPVTPATFELVLENGRLLSFPTGVAPSELAAVVRILEGT